MRTINQDIDHELAPLEFNRKEGICAPDHILRLRNRLAQLRSMSLKEQAESAQTELAITSISCMLESEMLKKATPDRELTTRSIAAPTRLISLMQLDEPINIAGTFLLKSRALELLERVRENG